MPLLFLLLILFVTPMYAQVKGRVTDAETGQPLAFVHIAVKDTRHGTMTDIDGNFNLYIIGVNDMIQVSYIGYYSKLQRVDFSADMMYIELHRRPYELQEVTFFAGENPAHPIIRRAIDNKSQHDPQNLPAFTYTSYNKFLATLDQDFFQERWEQTGDSVNKKLMDVLDKRHVFIMESVTERKFMAPDYSNEVVVANRVSGLENPMFTMLATELQPFSFYGNTIDLLGIKFISPLSRSAFNKYSYYLKDTLYQGRDSVFVISYQPEKNTNFEGLKGLLYIHSASWAIQNVIAEPASEKPGGLTFKIQQKYLLIDSKYWFPSQLNTDIKVHAPMPGQANAVMPVRMMGRSYIENIVINPPLKSRDFSNYTVDYTPRVNRLDNISWEKFRSDTLSAKEITTYSYMDSLGAANNFDRLLNSFNPLSYGELPMGMFNIPINSLYRFNEVERHRIGIGLKTNNRFSQRLILGGHYAWANGDRTRKYGYSGEVVLQKYNDIRIGASYNFDVAERGGSNFMQHNFILSTMLVRNLYMNKMDYTRQGTAFIKFHAFRSYLQGELSTSIGKTLWKDFYEWTPESATAPLKSFRFTEAALRLRFAYGESLINTPIKAIRLPSSYPVFYLNITKGFDNIYKGEIDYLKVEARADISYSIPLWGRQSWVLEGGWINNDNVPWALLHTSKAANRDNLLAAPFSFGTMYMNEFVAGKYAAVFFQHNFQSLLFRRPRYAPELVLITNAGVGLLGNAQNHRYLEGVSWDKGYFESGFAINKIIPQRWVKKIVFGISPGIEVLYRYGPYSLPRVRDNFTVKLSLVTAF